MSQSPPAADRIFAEALLRPAGPERAAYLIEACGDDAPLRQRVERLLRAHEDAASFLETPPSAIVREANPTIDQAPLEKPGTLIGPYKLLQQIGEGGMGVVYMAEQSEPVKRRVALKIIKPGMDTRQVIARFEAERQALSLMDHPNISKVLDAGATESGRPYFVMELVKGQPITQYCDEKHLTPRQRLELLLPVCQAIQHAHQKGIIHRDIKPTNILVAEYDQQPVPKVIDFGVAKATNQTLTEKTMFTGYGQIVGTLEYMSPEQAKVNQLDIDTRSDIYSLGVLLYELLTGSTPFNRQRLRSAAFDEMLRIIREEEPPKPSTRLSDSHDSLASISAQRQTEPAKLTKLVRGELDWIVMKALEKDRSRRYETATGLAADIQRYLDDEPVQACPPSAIYRFGKFARRSKGALAFTGLILLIPLTLMGGIGWNVRDRAARQGALEQEVNLALKEAEQLQEQAKWPEALSVVKRAEVLLAGGGDEHRERVHQFRKDLELVLRLEEIRLLSSEWKDGKFDWKTADRAYEQAFRDYGIDIASLLVEEAAGRIRARAGVEVVLAAALDDWAIVRRQTDKAASLTLMALAQAADPDPWRREVRLAVRHNDNRALAALAATSKILRQPPASLSVLGNALAAASLNEDRIEMLRVAQRQFPGDFWINFELAGALSTLEPTYRGEEVSFLRAALAVRPQNIAVLNNLGNVLQKQKKLDEAIACYLKAIELDPKFSYAYIGLASGLEAQDKLDEAVASYRKAIELDPSLSDAHNRLGNVLRDQAKLDEAITCHRRAIELDPNFNAAHNNLGLDLEAQGQLSEAIACYRKAIGINPEFSAAHNNLGNVLSAQGKLDEAIACYHKAIELDPTDPIAYSNLGEALRTQGKLDEAIACHRKAIELDSGYTNAYHNLGIALQDQGNLDEGIASHQKAIELDPKSAIARYGHGTVLHAKRELNEAIACYQKAIELDPKFSKAHYGLGLSLQEYGKLPEAIDCYRRAIELNPKFAPIHNDLGLALKRQGKLDEAIVCYRRAIELDPKYANAHINLGYALNEQDDPAQAIKAFEKVIELEPQHARGYNLLAWSLATCPDQSLRNPTRSVDLAKKAVELNPKTGIYWNTLGVAQYRAERWQDAIAALNESIVLSNGGDSNDWFFLSMSYWKLDNKDEARKWHEKAVTWMDKNQPKKEELRRFRSEAAELIGNRLEP